MFPRPTPARTSVFIKRLENINGCRFHISRLTGNSANHSLRVSRLYTDAVNKILLRHNGPILKFVLDVPYNLPKASDIDCWIEFVCKNGVIFFYLNDHRTQKLKPPSCLFSCVSLTHLTLHCDSLLLRPTFSGLPRLVSLKLYTCEVDTQKLYNLISKSPKLVCLELMLSKAIDSIVIRGSKLQHLVLESCFNKFVLDTEILKTLAVDIKKGSTVDMVAFLSSLPSLEKLQVSDFYACGVEPPKPEAERFEKLHTLILSMPLTCGCSISQVHCVLKNSPRLSLLQITVLKSENCECELVEFDAPCSIEPLKYVELDRFSGVDSELHFVKFLLAHSPALELMTIDLNLPVIRELEAKFRLSKELLRFRRASPNAELVLKP